TLDPLKLNRAELPCPSTNQPRATLSISGVNICLILAVERTLLDFPNLDFCTSITKRARSVGVVHKPAGASSGSTNHLPFISTPFGRCPAAAREARSGGSGC